VNLAGEYACVNIQCWFFSNVKYYTEIVVWNSLINSVQLQKDIQWCPSNHW